MIFLQYQKYQDLTFKIDLGTLKNLGKFSLFGIGGLSHMDYIFIDQGDDGDYDIHDINVNYKSRIISDMGVVGLSNLKILSSKSYIKTVFALTGTNRGLVRDTVFFDNSSKLISANKSYEYKFIISSFYNRKISAKNNFNLGFSYENVTHSFADSMLIRANDTYQTLLMVNGSYSFGQAYAQWQYKFNDQLIINSGVYTQILGMNKTWSAEPRLGFKWKMNNINTFSFGTGLHSQIQTMPYYLIETQVSNNEYIRTNKDLDMTKSLHFVAAYDFIPGKNFRIKIEPYYQYLYNVPVEQKPSYFSMLSVSADFNTPVITDSLENKGTGRNYGIDFTFEKFFDHNYYFLFTASLYNSLATGSDGIERNTTYNGNFALNALGGYEFKAGKNSAFLVDAKVSYLGNRRYIPVNLIASKSEGYPVYDYDNAFENRYKDFLKVNLKLSMRWNRTRLTHNIILDISNVLNTDNVWQEVYSAKDNKIATMYTYGIMPNFIYRIEF
jgi:hypothetical protein